MNTNMYNNITLHWASLIWSLSINCYFKRMTFSSIFEAFPQLKSFAHLSSFDQFNDRPCKNIFIFYNQQCRSTLGDTKTVSKKVCNFLQVSYLIDYYSDSLGCCEPVRTIQKIIPIISPSCTFLSTGDLLLDLFDSNSI